MNDVRGAFAVAGVLSSAAIACSIGALDGFSSGGPPDAPDAATSGGDAGAATDAASLADSAPDAGAREAGAAFDCSTGPHLLCVTFDDGMLARGWEAVTERAGGTLALDGDAKSAPFAMHAHLPAQNDATDQYARVAAGFDGTHAVRIAFDVKLGSIPFGPTDKAVGLFEINYAGTANSSYLFRARDEMTLSVEQSGTYTPIPALPYDAWTRVSVEVVPTSPLGHVKVSYDGVSVYDDAAVPFDPPGPGPRTEVFVGLVRYDPPAPAIDARYDNVVIDALP